MLRTKQLKQKQLQKELLARCNAAAGVQPALSRQLQKEYLAALKVDAKLADELWASELQLGELQHNSRLSLPSVSLPIEAYLGIGRRT